MADPIGEGFSGFEPASHLRGNVRTDARILTTQTLIVKKSFPLIFSSGNVQVAAVTGTNEQQTVTMTGSPTGGTFTLTYGGATTAAIPYNATALQVYTALVALSSIGLGNIKVTGTQLPAGTVTVEFTGALSATDVAAMTKTDSLTGGTTPATVITTATAGVKGYVTSTSICGFAAEWENGSVDGIYPRSFSQAPAELGLPFSGATFGTGATPRREMIFYPAMAGNLFKGCIDPTVAVSAATHVLLKCDIGYDPGNKLCYLRTGSTSNTLALITGIVPGQDGVKGGQVYFKILDAKSQYES